MYDEVPSASATHCEKVVAELQAKEPRVHGPGRRLAAEVDAEVVELDMMVVVRIESELIVVFARADTVVGTVTMDVVVEAVIVVVLG